MSSSFCVVPIRGNKLTGQLGSVGAAVTNWGCREHHLAVLGCPSANKERKVAQFRHSLNYQSGGTDRTASESSAIITISEFSELEVAVVYMIILQDLQNSEKFGISWKFRILDLVPEANEMT